MSFHPMEWQSHVPRYAIPLVQGISQKVWASTHAVSRLAASLGYSADCTRRSPEECKFSDGARRHSDDGQYVRRCIAICRPAGGKQDGRVPAQEAQTLISEKLGMCCKFVSPMAKFEQLRYNIGNG